MRRRKTQNSNLFAIDFDAIENVLQDANAPLISAAEDLLDRGSLIQEIFDTSDAENLKEIVAQIREQGKQLSKARLSDGRPFTDASSVVKNLVWQDRGQAQSSRQEAFGHSCVLCL